MIQVHKPYLAARCLACRQIGAAPPQMHRVVERACASSGPRSAKVPAHVLVRAESRGAVELAKAPAVRVVPNLVDQSQSPRRLRLLAHG